MATDKRLDQVSQLTDFDYALIVKGTDVAKVTKQQLAELVGNLLYGATTKETLASVVAGVIKPVIPAGETGENMNALTSNGIRLCVNTTTSDKIATLNYPSNLPYWILLTFVEKAVVLQVAFDLQQNTGFRRVSNNSGKTWSDWMSH